MPQLIPSPSIIQAAGTKPKIIEEYAGRVNSGHSSVSVARMQAAAGWVEPGQAVVAKPGEWLRYSCPEEGGAEYIAVCLPAFSPDSVQRDEE